MSSIWQDFCLIWLFLTVSNRDDKTVELALPWILHVYGPKYSSKNSSIQVT